MGDYVYACSVATGIDKDIIYCGITAQAVVNVGDLVELENGVFGEVTECALMGAGSKEISLLGNFAEINEITAIYAKAYQKGETNNV